MSHQLERRVDRLEKAVASASEDSPEARMRQAARQLFAEYVAAFGGDRSRAREQFANDAPRHHAALQRLAISQPMTALEKRDKAKELFGEYVVALSGDELRARELFRHDAPALYDYLESSEPRVW